LSIFSVHSLRQNNSKLNRWQLIVLILFLLLGSCDSKQQEILVLHAGSLSVPFAEISKAFMGENPGVLVRTEASGSRTCARKITELNVPADVMASADSEVIRQLLMPSFADFCIDFSSNEIVIIYSSDSIGNDRISDHNWPDILLSPQVRYGHSDPNADPCGYRTLLCWQLAEKYYNRPGLFQLLDGTRPKRSIRPKEVDLLALLDLGELDYVFIYRSVAEQHGYSYIVLPDEINLKSVAHESFYQMAKVEITGAKPGEKIVSKGAAIVYGITIPRSSQSPQWAARFVAFVLGPKGQKIMEANGQQAFVPAYVDNYYNLPDLLKSLVKKE